MSSGTDVGGRASAAMGSGAWARMGAWLRWRSPGLGQDGGGVVEPGFQPRRASAEVWIVLGLSLGQSGIYAIIQLIADLTEGPPLAAQATQLNVSRSSREYLDLTYQVAGIFFALIPVALAIYLLGRAGTRATRLIGLDTTRPLRDTLHGVALAGAIGIPGLAFYALGRLIGISVQVQAANLGSYWWTVPVLILSAAQNGLLEEVVVVGYLHTRLEQLRWRRWQLMLTSALLRGSYHLYQGFGAFVGNAVMGLVFGWYFQRTRRVMPLVVAHTIMDIVSFVGYALLPQSIKDAM